MGRFFFSLSNVHGYGVETKKQARKNKGKVNAARFYKTSPLPIQYPYRAGFTMGSGEEVIVQLGEDGRSPQRQ